MVEVVAVGGAESQRKKRLKPRDCGELIRKRLAESFEDIVSGFVKEAKGGSCSHLKLICELLDSEPKVRPVGKGSAEKMLVELKRMQRKSVQEPRVRDGEGKFVAREQGGLADSRS